MMETHLQVVTKNVRWSWALLISEREEPQATLNFPQPTPPPQRHNDKPSFLNIF